jgi:hypothetical protein
MVQFQMQKERYAARTEIVTIQAEGAIPTLEWRLAPQFGWLTVRTVPDGLAVAVNNEEARVSPLLRREVAPGAYEVRVADARYHETGQRVLVSVGAEREVSIVAVPREGAIEVSAVDVQGNAVTGKVSVNGRVLGEAPGTYKLVIGKHIVSVASDKGAWQGEVSVSEEHVQPVLARIVPRVEKKSREAQPRSSEEQAPWNGTWMGAYGQAWFNSESFHRGFDRGGVFANDPFTSPNWFGVFVAHDEGSARVAMEYEHYSMSNSAKALADNAILRHLIDCDALGVNVMWFWGKNSPVRIGAGPGAMIGVIRGRATWNDAGLGIKYLKSTGILTAFDLKFAIHMKLGAPAFVFGEAVARWVTADLEAIGGLDRHGLVDESDRIGLGIKW